MDSTCNTSDQSIHGLTVTTIDGSNTFKLSEYKGKVLLIVNVASFWGLAFQYPLLNALRKEYDGKVEVLGFPCNQFLLQEPAANNEILNFLKYVRPAGGFAPTFPMFQKVEVNGENADPLYKSLRVRTWCISSTLRLILFRTNSTYIFLYDKWKKWWRHTESYEINHFPFTDENIYMHRPYVPLPFH